MNLHRPIFFWTKIDNVNKTNYLCIFDEETVSDGGVETIIHSKLGEMHKIYGCVKGIVSAGCGTGIWSNIATESNTYNATREIDKSLIGSNFNNYDNEYPQISDIYNLGYRIDNGNIFWQKRSDYWSEEYRLFTGSGVNEDVSDGDPPFNYYIFTNIDTMGHLTSNYLPTISSDYHWTTNIKSGNKGFYVVPTASDKIARINKCAKYKDGLHWLHVYASNVATTNVSSNNMGTASIPFILDNFVPYISNIAIYQNYEQKYVAGYNTTETSIEEIEIEKDEGIDPEGVFNIEINFSEDMDVNKEPEVYVSNGTERCKETSGLWKNNRQYAFTFSSVDKKTYKMSLQKILI